MRASPTTRTFIFCLVVDVLLKNKLGSILSSSGYALIALVLVNACMARADSSIRLIAGGSSYVDSEGNTWSADCNYQGGSIYSTLHSVSHTSDSALYQNERYGTMGYSFSVPNGNYTVTLKFSELYWSAPGSRLFNTSINGQQVLSNFDIFTSAGGQYIAIDESFPISVSGGSINIAFNSVLDNAKIDAIQITPQQPSLPSSSAGSSSLRVVAGGSAYVDSNGNTWSADENFQGGSSYSNPQSVSNTADPTLYQTERYGNMNYSFTVPNGDYTVTLKFAELYWNDAGKRIFNTFINKEQVLSNFDIFASAGGRFTATDKSFPVTVSEGSINIAFNSIVDNAKVDAIQIVPQVSPSNSSSNSAVSSFSLRINTGGAYRDSTGNDWAADENYQGGSNYYNPQAISNTPDQPLYQTERYGNMRYNFAVPNGHYMVTLKFAELYWNGAGERIFSTYINDQEILSSFDIFASAGGKFIAIDKSFPVTVSNNLINIEFISLIDSAKVDAIQIVPLSSTVAPPITTPIDTPTPIQSPTSGSNGSGVQATSANVFLNSLGVGTHISQGYDQNNYVAPIKYLGVRNIRDGAVNLYDTYLLHKATGVLADLSVGCDQIGQDANNVLPYIVQYVSSTGSLLSLEGPNEPNNWPITYNGQQGGGFCANCTWLPVAKCQQDLYRQAKANTSLNQYPVFSVSQGGAETDNAGLQFLTIPAGANTAMPDGTQYADFANLHNYVSSNNGNLYEDNQAWLAADTQQNDFPGDTLYGEYGVTWYKQFTGYSPTQLQNLPRVTTETGWDSVGNPGGETVQGKVLSNTYLAQFKRGSTYTFMYELIDGEGGQTTQGLFHSDYTPKLAATYIHNLTSILADTATLLSPGTLNYSIPNQPSTVHDLLLQKSNGTLELVIWDERAATSDQVTVNLGGSFATINMYDITSGTTPVQTLNYVNSVSLTLSDHAIVLELKQ